MNWTNEEMIDKLFGPGNPLALLIPQEQKEKCTDMILQNPEVAQAVRDLVDRVLEIKTDFDDKIEKIELSQTYEGSCGITLFKTDDPKAQQILDKYLPRDGLNQHSYDLIKVFNEKSALELESDKYLLNALFSNPLNFIFMSHDKYFQECIRKNFPDVESAVIHYGDNSMNREIFTYLYSIDL